MLVQHLLTERIFRKIFNNPDFTRRNVVAAEIEKVISELTKRSLNRDEFLGGLERFYRAIERSAEETTNFSEKQHFLNKVYERFFQGYSPKEADTHGIVYTPQPIVNFMVRSVQEILQKEFGRSLGDKGVHILDPFVGTGNFIVRLMQEIKTTDLQYKYENELHCNEVMLLPYYIASMNIEHAYFDRVGEYKPFPGICLVDTFELVEADQSLLGFMTAENASRVKRQKESPIFVIIGNPPYNAGQVNEDDNNKNRKYPVLDKRVSETYAKDSAASNKNALSDPYIKAIRWASDRIGDEGIVALVTNSSFVRGVSFDGVRKHLGAEFSKIIHVNLKGDARTSALRRKQEGGNIFEDAIRVGVGISLFVRGPRKRKEPEVLIYDVPDFFTALQKAAILDSAGLWPSLPLKKAQVNSQHSWLTEEEDGLYSSFLSTGNKTDKGGDSQQTIFGTYGSGVATSRDLWAYNFSRASLEKGMRVAIETYNEQVFKWQRNTDGSRSVDDFVSYEASKISWSRDLKADLARGRLAEFSETKIRNAIYRPFVRTNLFFDRLFNEEVYIVPSIFPDTASEAENRLICVNDIAARSPFSTLILANIPDLHICSSDRFQCFPFYTYDEDGANRRENITDWALEQFRVRYADPSITKWDIFHYTYAVLHHPEYRERYAANLRRELPRIPFACNQPSNPCHSEPASAGEESASDSASKKQIPRGLASTRNDNAGGGTGDAELFRTLVRAGKRLAEIHVHYEQQPEYPLTKTEKAGEKLDWRVTKMRLSKDKTTLIYNQFLTLSGIPPATYEYRLGNRSALEWVIDQYQLSTDKRSGITNDPNRSDDPQYILQLIGQVVTVSLETVEIVRGLPTLGLPG